jgi:hypothetical protein
MKPERKVVSVLIILLMLACSLVSNPLNVTDLPDSATTITPDETIFPKPPVTARIVFTATGYSVPEAEEGGQMPMSEGTHIP